MVTPIQPRGVIEAPPPPYYVFSKDANLGSVPSISSEVLAVPDVLPHVLGSKSFLNKYNIEKQINYKYRYLLQ